MDLSPVSLVITVRYRRLDLILIRVQLEHTPIAAHSTQRHNVIYVMLVTTVLVRY